VPRSARWSISPNAYDPRSAWPGLLRQRVPQMYVGSLLKTMVVWSHSSTMVVSPLTDTTCGMDRRFVSVRCTLKSSVGFVMCFFNCGLDQSGHEVAGHLMLLVERITESAVAERLAACRPGVRALWPRLLGRPLLEALPPPCPRRRRTKPDGIP
jgi:hypothetical protein